MLLSIIIWRCTTKLLLSTLRSELVGEIDRLDLQEFEAGQDGLFRFP